MMRRIATALVAALALDGGAAQAQETAARPGWTFIPSFAFSETYDDNVTLFGRSEVQTGNDDLITAYTPQAELVFVGRRTRSSARYSGSLLDYRTFSRFNRWDQSAQAGLRRTESQRLSWSANANLTLRPSTDALEFDGIPFSHTGSTALTARGSVEYRFGPRDELTSSIVRQRVTFDRPDELLPYLRGGEATEWATAYRRRVSQRLGVGASYGLRGASAVGEPEDLLFHVARGAVDYQLTPAWSVSAGAGLDYIPATPVSPAQRAPGLAAAADWAVDARRFHVAYQRLFLPSFGFGGAIQSQEIGASFFTPLFRSRRFYTEQSVSFRDNRPLVEAPGRLRLRTLRTTSSVGWAPRPWIRMEGFYARAMQTTLITGGAIDRNRFGFVIITSRPVRVQ